MRKYLFVLLVLILSSCNNDYIENRESLINKEKETNVEITSRIDTTQTYYLYVSEDDILYAYNTKTELIDYKVEDRSGTQNTLIIFFFITYFVLVTLFSLSIE